VHELSIALSIVDMAAEESRRRGGAAVLAVHLRLGPLSGVVKEALCGAYELARERTALAEAALVIEETPLVLLCPRCEAERPAVSPQELCCAACGAPAGDRVARGRELEVFALELEDD
jgi:hydrogenase nickel incorporation protein HypA/HybF